MDIYSLIKKDHQEIASLFRRLKAAEGFSETSEQLFAQLREELELHAHGEFPIADPSQDVAGPLFEFGAGGRVREQGRPGQKQGAARGQLPHVERRDGPARLPVEHHHPAGRQAGKSPLERVLAHGVVHDLQASTPGEALDLFHEVLARVEDDLVRARLAGQRGLVLRGDRPDDAGAAHPGDLAKEQPYTAGGGVNEAGIAWLQRPRAAGEIVGGHALQHRGGAVLRAEPRRDDDLRQLRA